MKMRLKITVLCVTCLSLLFANTICAKAEESVMTEAGDSQVEISIKVPSTYSVRIPKKIVLSRDDVNSIKGTYQVEMISCDIAPTEYVCVKANSSVELTEQSSLEKCMATNSLTCEEFRGVASNDVRTGVIMADLGAGTWTGNLMFEITLNDANGNVIEANTVNTQITN